MARTGRPPDRRLSGLWAGDRGGVRLEHVGYAGPVSGSGRRRTGRRRRSGRGGCRPALRPDIARSPRRGSGRRYIGRQARGQRGRQPRGQTAAGRLVRRLVASGRRPDLRRPRGGAGAAGVRAAGGLRRRGVAPVVATVGRTAVVPCRRARRGPERRRGRGGAVRDRAEVAGEVGPEDRQHQRDVPLAVVVAEDGRAAPGIGPQVVGPRSRGRPRSRARRRRCPAGRAGRRRRRRPRRSTRSTGGTASVRRPGRSAGPGSTARRRCR